jgi:hypothetical protein
MALTASTPGFRHAAAPLISRLLASDPPLVNTTFAGMCADCRGHLAARLVNRSPRRPTVLVPTRSVAEAPKGRAASPRPPPDRRRVVALWSR